MVANFLLQHLLSFATGLLIPLLEAILPFSWARTLITAVVATNPEGKAYLVVQPGVVLPVNKEGITRCMARFGGNDTT